MGRRYTNSESPRLDLLYPLINDPDLINDPNPVAQPFLAVRLVKCPHLSPLPPSTTPSTISARAIASTSSPPSPLPPSTSSSPTRPTSSPTAALPATPAKWFPSTKAIGTNPAAPNPITSSTAPVSLPA